MVKSRSKRPDEYRSPSPKRCRSSCCPGLIPRPSPSAELCLSGFKRTKTPARLARTYGLRKSSRSKTLIRKRRHMSKMCCPPWTSQLYRAKNISTARRLTSRSSFPANSLILGFTAEHAVLAVAVLPLIYYGLLTKLGILTFRNLCQGQHHAQRGS